MDRIKSMTAAGKFYTENKVELLVQLNSFEKKRSNDYDYLSRAIIVPHAGYIYSGQLASEGFQYLDKNIKNVFIIAPSHYAAVKNAALSGYDKWSTPIGEIEVNQEINDELVKKFGCEFQDNAFLDEHAVEVQIPFLQTSLQNVKIVPVLTGENYEKIKEIIKHYWQNPENGFVISSDLSHFYSSAEAKKIDTLTAEMIETNDIEKFNSYQACGSIGVRSLVLFAREKGYSLIRAGMINSGDITGDNSRVVGYGSWMLYEGGKNSFIKKYFSKYVIDICRESIYSRFTKEEIQLKKIPEVFLQTGACFVTLEKNNDLRGCIGSITARHALIDDLIKNARNAAFSDPRFEPLKEHEFENLEIEVSLLSALEKMNFQDEADLLSQIRPFKDGIIIKDKNYQAVYLPSVWEQLPEKETFLNSLKIKAGLPPKHFSTSFEAYRFTTEYIKSS